MGRAWGSKVGALLRAGCAVACTALTALTPSAHAQPSKTEITRIEWGYKGLVPGEQWAPLRVYFTSPEAWSGQLIIDYPQDATQRARTVTPFAITPGTESVAEAAVCIADGATRIELTLTGERGSVRFTCSDDAEDQRLTLPVVGIDQLPLIVIEGSSASVVSEEHPVPSQARPGTAAAVIPSAWTWARASAPLLKPSDLPRAWIAYDAAACVIARAEDLSTLDRDQRSALKTWVESGGRLILQVDVGGEWRRWLEDGTQGDVVDVAPLQPVTFRAGEIEFEAQKREATARSTAESADPSGPQPRGTGAPSSSTGAVALGAAIDAARTATLQARAMSLSEAGRRAGWGIGWPGTGEGLREGAGLFASGPVGLGFVTLIGIDPARVPEVVNEYRTLTLWRDLIERADPQWNRRQDYYVYYGGAPSGGTEAEKSAIQSALETTLADVRIQPSLFLALGATVVLLAIVIGPVDRLLLGRLRALHTSWLTALGWIALAGAAAYLLPAVMRSSDGATGRTAVIDAVLNAQGRPVYAAQTGVTGVFAARPGRFALDELPPSAWVRGVSPVRRDDVRSLDAVTIVQNASAQGRSGLLQPWRQGQWTVRAFLDRAADLPETAIPTAKVERSADEWTVRIEGVTASSLNGWLQVPDLVPLTFTPSGDGVWIAQGRATTDASVPAAVSSLMGHQATSLPGVTARSLPLSSRARSGHYATLQVVADAAPAGLSIKGPGLEKAPTVQRIYRLAVPIETTP